MTANPELAPGVRWFDVCDDMEHLAVAALDTRLSWDEADDPWRIAAWIKWQHLRRWQRDWVALRAASVRARTAPPAIVGMRPHLDDALVVAS